MLDICGNNCDLSVAAASFNESTESIEQEQEQELDSPTETDLSVVSDVHAETEDSTIDDDDASLLPPKPVLDRWTCPFCDRLLVQYADFHRKLSRRSWKLRMQTMKWGCYGEISDFQTISTCQDGCENLRQIHLYCSGGILFVTRHGKSTTMSLVKFWLKSRTWSTKVCGLCRKVGGMQFWLYATCRAVLHNHCELVTFHIVDQLTMKSPRSRKMQNAIIVND